MAIGLIYYFGLGIPDGYHSPNVYRMMVHHHQQLIQPIAQYFGLTVRHVKTSQAYTDVIR